MTVPHTPREAVRQRRRRTLALTATGALVVATLGVLNTGTATAEVRSATTGSFQWGIKRSLFTYHFNHEGTTQHLTQGDGATAGPVDEDNSLPAEQFAQYWNFPLTSGSYDTTTNQFTAQYGGYVLMTEEDNTPSTGPTGKSPFKYIKFANPKVVLDFTANTKKLFVDVSEAATATGTPTTQAAVEFANLTIASGTAPVGDVVSYSNVVTRLAAGGVAVFTDDTATPPSAFYPLDTALDRSAMSLTAPAGAAPTPTPTGTPTSTPTPTPTPPAGGSTTLSNVSFDWAWNDYVQKQNQGGCFFMSAADASTPTTASGYNATNYKTNLAGVQILKNGSEPVYADRCVGSPAAPTAPGLGQKVHWTGGTGSRAADGTTTVNFTGILAVNYNNQVRIKDPVLTITPAGVGTLVAQVAAGTSTTYVPATVADLIGLDPNASTFTSVPVYTYRSITVGTATAPTALAQSNWGSRGLAWGAWPESFVNAMPSAIRTFFYSTGDSGVPTDANLQKGPTALSVNLGSAGNGGQNLSVAVTTGTSGTGEFSWAIGNGNPTVSLSGGTPSAGNTLLYTGALNQISVTDARSAGTWSLSGQVADFTSGSDIFGGYYLGWFPAVVTGGANAVAGAAVLPGTAAGQGLSTSKPLATGGFGGNPVTGVLGGGLSLRIPATTPSGTYTATLTLTAVAV